MYYSYIHPQAILLLPQTFDFRYFCQSNLDESNYLSENANSYYGIVVYQAADCLPHLSTDTIGPFSSSNKLLNAFEKLE